MKARQLLHILLVFVAGQLFFACNSARYYDFGKNSTAYREVARENKQSKPAEAENALAATEIVRAEAPTTHPSAPNLETSAADATPALPTRKIYEAEPATAAPVANAQISETAKKASVTADLNKKLEKKKTRKGLFAGIKAIKATILEIVFAILLPPVAVALHEGITTRFWISILLTLLFWLPGIIYAFLIITDTI